MVSERLHPRQEMVASDWVGISDPRKIPSRWRSVTADRPYSFSSYGGAPVNRPYSFSGYGGAPADRPSSLSGYGGAPAVRPSSLSGYGGAPAVRPSSLSGYGGGPNRCLVKVPGSTPGKIPNPSSNLGKMTKWVVRYEEDASDPTAVWRIATAANHKADRVQQQKGDFQKVITELHESMDRVEAMLQRLVNSQAQTLDQTVGRGVSHLQPSEKSRSVEELCQINLNSTQGIQLMSTTEGNFKFPSTYPSVVVTGWDEDPLPHAIIASSTLNNLNPSHGPELASQCPRYPRKIPEMVHSDDLESPEVYGIDPYTHNWPKEIMPAVFDWSIDDKHAFIEENKQVRYFTGSGNTPMVYFLKPVIEEIQKSAKESGDRRIAKMCLGMLKAMRSHHEYNYVAYKKGIGVVGNKKGGFGVDDRWLWSTGLLWTLPPWPDLRLCEADWMPINIEKGVAAMCLMMAAMFGGTVGQEVVQACWGKFHPVYQEMVKVLRSMKPLQLDDVEIGQHKSHHCYFIRLTLEYFKFSSLDSYEFSACKFNSPKHRPYVILSKTITAPYIIYGAILMRQPAEFNPLQFDVVYCSEGYNGYAVVSSNKDWIGVKEALAFQNYLKSKCLGKMDWNETSQQGKYNYGWLAKEEDDKSGDPVDRVLSENGDHEEMDGLVSLVESAANGDFTLKSDSQFDPAAFYEAIKPLTETGLLEEEFPDSLPHLGLYPFRAANWKVQRKKGNTMVSSPNQEYVHCAPYCVPIGFICKNSRMFYNPFNGNVSLQPEYSIVETEEKYICALCLVLTETAQTNICSLATLILCPAPILAQWHYGITRHIRPGSLQFYIYEGARKSDCTSTQKINMTEISIADIVLTTYDVLKEDLSKDPDRHDGDWHFSRFQKRYTVIPTVLTMVRWWRLCLDEAQMVEPSKTSVTEMAMRLKAQHLWCITGTPIQIRCEDPKVYSKILSEEFGWDKNLAKKSWCFGPETTGPNMEVEMCKENMRGICFEVCDVVFHADAIPRSGSQVVHTARRVIHASQLTPKPRLLEPVYLVEIKTLENAILTSVKELGNQNSPEKLDRTTFYYILGLLVFMEDGPVKFRSFMMLPVLMLSFPFMDAVSSTDVVKYAIIGWMKDLRGIAMATNSRRIYGLLFDWMYPSRMPLLLRTILLWADESEVTTPLFKFMYEFAWNKAQRLTFDSSSPNGILLFREISKLIVAYGSRILLLSNGTDIYGSKYKGMWISLTIPSRVLCGNYVNFGVFKFYGDRTLADALDLSLKMTLSVPLSDIMAFEKLSKAYFGYGSSIQQSYQFCFQFGYRHIHQKNILEDKYVVEGEAMSKPAIWHSWSKLKSEYITLHFFMLASSDGLEADLLCVNLYIPDYLRQQLA